MEGFSKVSHAITSLQRKGITVRMDLEVQRKFPAVKVSSHQCTGLKSCRPREIFCGVY